MRKTEEFDMVAGKNSRNERNIKILKTVLKHVAYILPTIIFIFPVFILVTRSFFTTEEITQIGTGLFPKKFNLIGTYKEVFSNTAFLNGLKNTLLIVVCNVIGVPLTAFMAAYAFVKVPFVGKKLIFTAALGTIMIPSILLLLPVYKIFVDIGWYDTLLPLTIPAFFGGGIMNIFMIMQFIRGIPGSLDEVAKLDGANMLQRMFLLTLPLIKPIILYVAVTAFMTAWNDLMQPLLYIQSRENWTVNMYIFREYLSTDNVARSKPNVQMGIGVVLMLPMLVIFMFYQETLIEGLTFTGMKE
mgnify:FL=1